MDVEWIREFCLGLPHTTEQVQWGDALLFKVGGKMYTVVSLSEIDRARISFRATEEEAAELVEIEGIIPAPYLARYHWVALETLQAMKRGELKKRIQRSYDLVFAALPKKTRGALGGSGEGNEGRNTVGG